MDNTITTRFRLRYDTVDNWEWKDPVLLKGEVAIVEFHQNRVIESMSNSLPSNTPPAIGIKIGNGSLKYSQLPWIQAVAADVYRWAKASTKPTYSASEISGLDTYIEEHAGGGGGGGSQTSVARQYQIYAGTDNDANKYFLRYKNDDSSTWTVDTAHYVDLTPYAELRNWVGPSNIGVANGGYNNLRSYIGASLILPIVQSLKKDDAAVENQYVTSVKEVDGIITVYRKQPAFTEISGTLTVDQGGTGLATIPSGEVLIGNGTGALNTMAITTTVNDDNSLVPSYAIKAYVDTKTAGLTGAMHYVDAPGVAVAVNSTTGAITVTNLPEDYRPIAGDVIIYGFQEYLYTGGRWRLFGDEGSYILKGSVTDADIVAEANIQMSKIAGLTSLLQTKVDKEEGKMLSSNDYTTDEKLKLAGIAVGAQVNSIEHVYLNNHEVYPTTVDGLTKVIDLHIREFDENSATKLSGIAEGAQVNNVETILLNGTEYFPNNNKQITLTVNEITTEEQRLLAALADVEPGAQVNNIEKINFNGTNIFPDNTKTINIVCNEITTAERALLTALGDGAYTNTIEGITLNGTTQYPDNNKIVNLTVNEITAAERTKLEGIAAGAQVNVLESITFNGTTVPISGKTAAIEVYLDPHTEHINKIEKIFVNDVEQTINAAKEIHLTLTKASLGFNYIEGAVVPNGLSTENVNVDANSKLVLARIAKTGAVQDIIQPDETYIVINCGSSTTVI